MATVTNHRQHDNAGHIRKRPYQPSITSYFNNRDTSNASSSAQLAYSTSPLSPPLSAETQASLLSVGMRVRKSVPEGYKTHKTLGCAGFPFPSSAPATKSMKGIYANVDRSTKELMPFCGLHKIGGWAAQEMPSSAPAVMEREDMNVDGYLSVPGLSMSQSTLSSMQGSFGSLASEVSASRKRTYEEETEEEIDAYFEEVEAEEIVEQQMVRDDRPIARVKGTSTGPDKGRPGGVAEAVRVVGEDDFEEAGFLAPMDVDEA